ncbi:UPF0225 protein [Fulvitalea axinellae]|uniref:UPF0225 protein n=1 Tax=Fulvitalea axinellae TaxID=1182444 RepID=A0AAU9CDJ7_9BACT|nr:UPF0225 protein [Fulvitalea axinellae]
MEEPKDLCPCGSGKSYKDCCGGLHSGSRKAQTALELMKSRYCAYVIRDIDYIKKTTHPDFRKNYNFAQLASWSKETEWDGLEIVEKGSESTTAKRDVVSFKAYYKEGGIRKYHAERSSFKKYGGDWHFCKGSTPKA